MLAMIVWLGTGLSVPVVADIRRTLSDDIAVHGPGLIARLRTTTQVVVPAAVVTLATGIAMVFQRGGFGAVHWRIHAGLVTALLVMAVGGAFTSRRILQLEQAIKKGDKAAGAQAARGLVPGLRLEDVLRLTALLLMALPIENW